MLQISHLLTMSKINQVKRKLTDYDRNFATYISDGGLIPKKINKKRKESRKNK